MPLRSGGFVYPGNPEIDVSLQQSIAAGAGANVSTIQFGSHSGTHVDAARHFFQDGQPVDLIPLDKLVGPALLVRLSDDVRAIGETELRQFDLGSHKRILLATRNSALLGKKEFASDYTYLAPAGAAYLVQKGFELVGIDYLSIEQFHSGHHRTHRTLLERSVVIVEGLDLSVPNPGEYQLVCLPLRLEGCDGAPARAILIA
ncbi:MAG: cyclase family protein [Gemmatimonadaceae bacterium]